MALTGADRGTGVGNVSGTTHAFSPASNFTAGSMAVICVVVNNSNTNGAAHSTFTVTDDAGNTWTRRSSPLYDPGAANEGLEGGIFTTSMNGGTITTSTVVTVTIGTASAKCAVTFIEVSGNAGTPTYSAQGVGAGANTDSPTVTTDSIPSGDVVIGMLGVEFDSVTITGDGDSSNGSWSTQQTTATGGPADNGLSISSQQKVTTGTGAQTFNPTLSAARDCIPAWISITEVVVPSVGCLLSIFGRRRGRR